jgi:GDP-D-mannose 3',5'-epimerase
MAEPTVVAGAGGFIGGHLVADLIAAGEEVRGVDIKPLADWLQRPHGAELVQLDLSKAEDCREALDGAARVYNLAADMGGMGFLEANRALCMLSVLINTHLLQAGLDAGVDRFFFASSACVYAADKQLEADVTALREQDAYPAAPEDGYGWEKLFSERMCRNFSEDFGLETRVARFHNVYGPQGSFEGGREKAPAAICRKVALAELSGRHEIEVWGDGEQTRSFMYIDDCLHGTKAIMGSGILEPINLGSSELVSINQLVDKVERIAGIEVDRLYDTSKPQGVRGRNSDNAAILQKLGWQPSIPLDDGLARTYAWIHEQLAARVTA